MAQPNRVGFQFPVVDLIKLREIMTGLGDHMLGIDGL
jgi:hypothetical protein